MYFTICTDYDVIMSLLSCYRRTSTTTPVFLDVLSAGLAGAEPLIPVMDQEPPDDVPGGGLQVYRPLNLPRQDLLVYTEGIVVKEGRIAGQHLVYEDAQSPPVHRLVVTLGLDDLRSQILRGPAQCPGPVSDPLGKPEICDLQVSGPDKK